MYCQVAQNTAFTAVLDCLLLSAFVLKETSVIPI